MAVSIVGLIALAGIAGLVFLAVLGLVALLTSPRTRESARILMGGLAALAMLGLLLGGLYLGLARHELVQTERARVQSEMARMRAIEASRRAEIEAGVLEEVTASAPGGAAAETQPAEGPAEALPEGADEAEKEKDLPAEAPEEPGAEPVEAAASEAPAPLSVEPELEERPSWAEGEPYKEGSVYYWPVVTEPRPDAEETIEEALPEAIEAAVAEYARTKLELVGAAGRVRIDPKYAVDHLVGDDRWIEPVNTSFGPWVRLHALLKFDHDANELLKQQGKAARVAQRLWGASAATCVVLFFLAMVYCYLKIDLVTGGARRGILRVAAILVILGLIVVVAGVARVIVA